MTATHLSASSASSRFAEIFQDIYECMELQSRQHPMHPFCMQVVVRKNPDAATDEERARLEVVGRFHTGEFVNRIRPGSLVMRLPDSELGAVPTFLFGGVNGSVGLVASLPRDWFEMLAALQEGLRKVRYNTVYPGL